MNQLYASYPKTMEEYPKWRATVTKEMDEVKEKFKPNPI